MARGTRAPSQHAYRGAVGHTQTANIHVSTSKGDVVATVYTAIDAVDNPELVARFHADELNVIATPGGEPVRAAVPVVYHDSAAELMVLVLSDAHRHRELDERIALLQRLRDDVSPIPSYVKDFAVVFGTAGLRAYLEHRAEEALVKARSPEGTRERELDRRKADLDQQRAELERVRHELDRTRSELTAKQAELSRRNSGPIAQPVHAPEPTTDETTIGAPPSPEDMATAPVGRFSSLHTPLPAQLPMAPATAPASAPVEPPAAATNGVTHHEVDHEFDDGPTGSAIVPQGADPLTTETIELPLQADPWLDFAATGATSSFHVERGRVRLALIADEQVTRGLGGELDIRVLLHRAQTYPVIAFVIGPPAALRVPSPRQLAFEVLDVGLEHDRQVLDALAHDFKLEIELIARGQSIRHVQLIAPLADNVGYVVRAADDHLRALTADGETEASFERARELVLGDGYDLLGLEHTETSEFRDDKLAQLQTAQQLRRAIAMARRFARPSREDYLVCARGFPISRWHELRRHVLQSAVAWGLWMGPELAQVAVSEGLARSRRDLIVRLGAGFEALRANPAAYDIDADAAADNAKALAEEARALGVELGADVYGKLNGHSNGHAAIASEDRPVVSGSIERTPTHALHGTSTPELIALLDDKKHRLAAAIELCDRGESAAAPLIVGTAKKLPRSEAVRVLGKSVKLGPPAAQSLIDGLGSSKAFLRHGCALALALLHTDEGTSAVIEQLFGEPTEIWREIARAIGQIGTTALMPLAAQTGRLGDNLNAQIAERVAWAMAHIGVRGGKGSLEQMAAGQSVIAPIAAHALELLSSAANDDVRLRPEGAPPRDVTVNRAFSRRFFEALEPDEAASALGDLEASTPMEMLDEADLIADEADDEAELDESDLIQT